jgi:hypothetical protein
MTHQAEKPPDKAQRIAHGVLGIPGGIAHGLMAGPRLMGDVMEGRVDPNSPEAIRESANAALSTMGIGVLGAEKGAIGALGGAMKTSAPEFKPRIVSSKPMQESVLRNEWKQHGPDLDYEDLPESVWNKEVKAWNADHPAEQIGETYREGSRPEFEKSFTEKHLSGKKRPFPGVRKANTWFEEQGEPEHGAYLSGEELKD